MKQISYFLPIIISILACGTQPSAAGGAPPTQPTAAEVVPTVMPDPSTSVPDLGPGTGTVTGRLSYPSEFIPPMRVVFFSLTDGSVSYIDTGMDQGTYSIDLPAGSYNAIAYIYSVDTYTTPEPGTPVFAGGYTRAVPCGLSVDCSDHSLITITVTAGQTTTADPRDWYVPVGTFPSMPAP